MGSGYDVPSIRMDDAPTEMTVPAIVVWLPRGIEEEAIIMSPLVAWWMGLPFMRRGFVGVGGVGGSG